MTEKLEITNSLIAKYMQYISNLQWHIKTNKPKEPELTVLYQRIGDYREVVFDLKKLTA